MNSDRSLPSSWSSTTLGTIREDRSASVDPSECKLERFELYSIPAFPSGVPEVVTGAEIGSTKKSLSPGTVVVSKINPRINRVWVVGGNTGRRQIGSSEWIPFFPINGIDPKYLAYFLRQDSFRNYVAANVSGVGGSLMRVKPSTVDLFDIDLAPRAEQHRIVESIESYFTRLDDAMASLERVQRNLKRHRASVLNAAVEGRLVPTEAELARAENHEYEPASVLLERILAERRRRWEEAELAKMQANGKVPKNDGWKARYKEPVAPDTSELPELPEGWCWVTLDCILAAIEAGKSFQCVERPPDSSQIGVVKVSSVSWGTFNEDESKTCTRQELVNPNYFIRCGDLLISRANTIELIGAAVIVGALSKTLMLSDKILRLRTIGGMERWLLWVLRSSHGRAEIERLATGNQDSMRNIGQNNIRRIRIPLPPEMETKQIVEAIDEQLSTAEGSENAVHASELRLSRLRQSILKWAFEGRLVDQDPADEPASKLLARIKAERAVEPARSRTRRPRRTTSNGNAR